MWRKTLLALCVRSPQEALENRRRLCFIINNYLCMCFYGREFMKKFVFLMALLMAGTSVYSQKEYRQIRELLKNNNEGVIGMVENCLKNDKFKEDPELLHYGVEAWLVANSNLNRKAYLKEKYDTAKLFNSVLNMYNYAVRCDTMEAFAASKKGRKKIKYKYRSSHGDLLRSQYGNLYNGGQFSLLKKDFANAYIYFSMYYDIRATPLFGGGKISKRDSLNMQRAAYWATVCAFQTNNKENFFKYNAAALRDTTYRQKELELTARLYKAGNDTAAFKEILKIGVKEYPQQDYFFTNLTDCYNSEGQFDRAMALADNILKHDPRSIMAQYGRSLVFLKMKRYDECIILSKSIIQSDSTYSEAYYNVGAAYLAEAAAIRDKVRSDMKLVEIRNIKREEDKLMRNALPYLEHYRKLNPSLVEWWGRPLYNIYLALNMGDKFEEVERLIDNAEKAKAEAAAKAAQAKKK